MRMQSHANLCGPAALANAFRTVGKTHVTEDKVAKAIKVAASAVEAPEQDGAGVRSLQRAAEAFGYALTPWTFAAFEQAWAYTLYSVGRGQPCLLAVDSGQTDEGHWITAIGTVGDSLLVADPAESEIVEPVTARALDTRWKDGSGSYYLLALAYVPKRRKK